MAFSVLRKATDPYTRFESWFYDTFIARGISKLYERMDSELSLAGMETGRALDVGCGGGQLLLYMAKTRPLARLFGIDLSPEQVARAKKRLSGYNDRVEVRQASALDLPFEDASMDLVISVGSIKHWPDQEKGLSECVRVLAPGKRLIIGEAERGCRLSDVDALFHLTPMPRVFRLGFRMFFLTYVAGPSLSEDDMGALFAKLPLKSAVIRRISGLPVLMAYGEKK